MRYLNVGTTYYNLDKLIYLSSSFPYAEYYLKFEDGTGLHIKYYGEENIEYFKALRHAFLYEINHIVLPSKWQEEDF